MQRRPEEIRVCCEEPLAREEGIVEAKRRRKNSRFVFITMDVSYDVGFRHQAEVVSSFCCDLSGSLTWREKSKFSNSSNVVAFSLFGGSKWAESVEVQGETMEVQEECVQFSLTHSWLWKAHQILLIYSLRKQLFMS